MHAIDEEDQFPKQNMTFGRGSNLGQTARINESKIRETSDEI